MSVFCFWVDPVDSSYNCWEGKLGSQVSGVQICIRRIDWDPEKLTDWRAQET